MNNFRERLDDLLIDNNMSKNQLASQINVSPETIYGYYKKNLLPEIKIAKRIADLFNCSLDYLFGLTVQLTNKDVMEAIRVRIENISQADFVKKITNCPASEQLNYCSVLHYSRRNRKSQ